MNPRMLLDLLPWILPPVIGALIGYITNAIAIRMLFRPLKELRFLGLRLPFTPGIIPRQRHQLAQSIGRMVSTELITEEAIKGQLNAEGFRRRLYENIEALIGDLLHRPLGTLQPANREALFRAIEQFLAHALFRFFSSRSFIHLARRGITTLIQALTARAPGTFLDRINLRALVGRLASLAGGAETRRKVVQKVRNWLEQGRMGNHSLNAFIPEELLVSVAEIIPPLLPFLFDRIFRWLREDSTRRELQIRGKRLLRDVLDKLNLVQKFLISAAQYDRTLEEKMPAIVDDALASLEDFAYEAKVQQQIGKALKQALSTWATGDSTDFVATLEDLPWQGLIDKALGLLEREEIQERITRGLKRFLAAQGQRSLGEILARYLGVQEQDLIEHSSYYVLQYLAKQETAAEIATGIVSLGLRLMEEEKDNTVQGLFQLEPTIQPRAAAYITEKLISILDRRLPVLIQSFDVQDLVVNRINQLDVADVERMLMMVIAKHLKWINIFGAILGALIGLAQVILSLFR